jgi:hypothetical protein
VREPDELGAQRTHPNLALGARLVELAKANSHITADDNRPASRLQDDHLQTTRVARRRNEPKPRQQLQLTVNRHITHPGRINLLPWAIGGRAFSRGTFDDPCNKRAGREVDRPFVEHEITSCDTRSPRSSWLWESIQAS